MASIDQPGYQPEPPQDARGDEAIVSPRSLLIIIVSAGVALLVGSSAGLSAALELPPSIGPGWRVVVGLVAALGTGCLVGLGVASTLNRLIARS
jgi:hypothetical protein